MKAVITYIDFREAFDSINRDRNIEIIAAYGIPTNVVNDTSAAAIAPEGKTNAFKIDT